MTNQQNEHVAGGSSRGRVWGSMLGGSVALGRWCWALLIAPLAANAQSYTIDWYKIAGGGGTSTGGVYAVSGTIGQHDAGPAMSGAHYSLSGGFWALYAAQTPGAPLLSIFLTSSNTVVVSWPAASAGFRLEQNADLNTTNWVAPAEMIISDGTTRFIIVSAPTGKRFFRLKPRGSPPQ